MLKTRVVVVNLSPFNLLNSTILRAKGGAIELKNFKSFEFQGADVFNYLQGQVTSDLTALKDHNEIQLCARVDFSGRLKSYFYIYGLDGHFYLLVESILADEAKCLLENNIISEDVVILPIEKECFFAFGVSDLSLFHQDVVASGTLFNESGVLFFNRENFLKFNHFSNETIGLIKFLNFYPQLNLNCFIDGLVWETPLAITLGAAKGCFLGQEPISKVLSRRGANYYPVFLTTHNLIDLKTIDRYLQNEEAGRVYECYSFHGNTLFSCSLKREFRVANKEYQFKFNDETVTALCSSWPYLGLNSKEGKANFLHDEAAKNYIANKTDDSIALLEMALSLKPDHLDSLESLGVILRGQSLFQKSIDCFKKIIELAPENTMPHTNLSILYAQMGRIEEAEEEKRIAITKDFKKNQIAYDAKVIEDQKNMEREKMFWEILNIDPEDSFANISLAEIYFTQEKWPESKKHLMQILENDSDNLKALLLMGKILLKTKEEAEGQIYLARVVEIAIKKGELKVAEEAQSIL